MATRNQPAKDAANDVVESSPAEMVGVESRPTMQLESWEDAIRGADTVLGRDLAKDELFDKLVGVPFLITKINSYPGKGLYERADGTKVGRDFFAIEARLAPENIMRDRLVNLDDLRPFEPDQLVVFNDSSTGIRRQLVQYLYGSEAIDLPTPITLGGKLGESSFDLPVSEWKDIHRGEMRFDEAGNAIYVIEVKLFAPRGIRVSNYHNDYTDEGKTRYLA